MKVSEAAARLSPLVCYLTDLLDGLEDAVMNTGDPDEWQGHESFEDFLSAFMPNPPEGIDADEIAELVAKLPEIK